MCSDSLAANFDCHMLDPFVHSLIETVCRDRKFLRMLKIPVMSVKRFLAEKLFFLLNPSYLPCFPPSLLLNRKSREIS